MRRLQGYAVAYVVCETWDFRQQLASCIGTTRRWPSLGIPGRPP